MRRNGLQGLGLVDPRLQLSLRILLLLMTLMCFRRCGLWTGLFVA